MSKKWGSNEGIRIGDIFWCWCGPYVGQPDSDYYQIVALRGKTQVVLRPLRMETYINDGIEKDSPLYWLRERKRPLPGQFMTADELVAMARYERGKEIRRTGEEVTAWVLPDKTVEGRLLLQEVRWGSIFWHVRRIGKLGTRRLSGGWRKKLSRRGRTLPGASWERKVMRDSAQSEQIRRGTAHEQMR